MNAVSGMPTRYLYDSADSLLRFAVRADATITGVCGLAVALVGDSLASLTGLSPAVEYGLAGFFLVYGLVVYGFGAVPDLRRVGIVVVAANIAFTLAAVVVAEAAQLTASGVAASLVSALYTAVFATLQYLGLRRLETA
ncbi:hypothetical protein [Mycobacterium shigaense]|uniref:Uncharacterized protein n=1 Tax=Mycobacterium shigaense TaxID=722731 RepID=A0A1Z4EMA3_9MYCO|nr:hypothetical protein [Mycobacterium shigaense]MEA1120844.1 hypothetical protein [Mycobacterium shigaense]PRI12876.1 hypothetical protein B2J96_22550 [Mycobacterium shigaense]BAX94061.1 hypothetical protein MSG_03936 [Mycobacterium shigaense]